MVMENYYSHEKYRDLWLKINHLHLSYLDMEESREKIVHRSKLEGNTNYLLVSTFTVVFS